MKPAQLRRTRWLWLTIALIAICLAVLPLPRSAASGVADMALERWVISGGETQRATGALAMSATTGQPVVALSSSDALTLYWGYWGPGQYEVYLPVVLKDV